MITALAYLGINSPRKDDWPQLATGVWGAMVADPGPDGAVRIKIDEALWRVQIHPGEKDEVAYLGWMVDAEEDLDAVADALDEMGIAVERGDAELAEARGVNQILSFTDPWEFRHEVTWGQMTIPWSFAPTLPMSGFVTGAQGLGHVLLLLPDIEEGHRFYSRLGFVLSDKIIVPGQLNARFYHCNKRHHTLAIGQCPPGMAGLQHMMLQTNTLDDVGLAYDRVLEQEVPITFTIGRHTNDEQFSFYHALPSSFHCEYGWGGLEITEDWVTRTFDRTATWGHHRHPSGKGQRPAIIHKLPEGAPQDAGTSAEEKAVAEEPQPA